MNSTERLRARYSFVLDWDDLPDAAKCEKVFRYAAGRYNEEAQEIFDELDFEALVQDDALLLSTFQDAMGPDWKNEDKGWADRTLKTAEKRIKAHFPIYF